MNDERREVRKIIFYPLKSLFSERDAKVENKSALLHRTSSADPAQTHLQSASDEAVARLAGRGEVGGALRRAWQLRVDGAYPARSPRGPLAQKPGDSRAVCHRRGEQDTPADRLSVSETGGFTGRIRLTVPVLPVRRLSSAGSQTYGVLNR